MVPETTAFFEYLGAGWKTRPFTLQPKNQHRPLQNILLEVYKAYRGIVLVFFKHLHYLIAAKEQNSS